MRRWLSSGSRLCASAGSDNARETARIGNLKRALRPMLEWRGAGVPQGCRIRGNRRRELVSAPRCCLREAGAGFDALTFDGAVDGGAADAEEFGDLGGAVLTAVHQRDQVCFLAAVELGLLAAQPAFGLGDLHALAGAEPDQVGTQPPWPGR